MVPVLERKSAFLPVIPCHSVFIYSHQVGLMGKPYKNSYVIHTVNEATPPHDVKMPHLPFLFLCTNQAMPVSYISSGCNFCFFSKHWSLTVITPLESLSSAWYFIEVEDCYVSGTYTILRVRVITQPCFGVYNLSAKSLVPSVV